MFMLAEYKSTDANIVHNAATDPPISEGVGHEGAKAITLKPAAFRAERYRERLFEGDVYFNTLGGMFRAASCFVRR